VNSSIVIFWVYAYRKLGSKHAHHATLALSSNKLGSLAASRLPGEPVGPPARWAASE